MRDDNSSSKSAEQSKTRQTSLFRKEATEYLGTRQYGSVLLTLPLSHKLLTFFFFAVAMAIIAFFAVFGVSRKAECQGTLGPTAGVLRIIAIQGGTIVEVKVKEGQRIQAGDVMFVLTNERSNTGADSSERAVTRLLEIRRKTFGTEAKQVRVQNQLRMKAVLEKAADLENESLHLREQFQLQEERLELVEQSRRRYADLRATGFISDAQLQEKQAEVLDQRQRLADIQRSQAAIKRSLTEARSNVADLRIQAERDQYSIEREANAIGQDILENEARREIIVRAPVDGSVAAVNIFSGQSVSVNSTLASVLPAGAELEAEIFATSKAIGFIRPGMKVLLRYQAYPYQKFGQHGAVVREISQAPLTPQELSSPISGNSTSEPVYRIRLKLDSQTVRAYGQDVSLKSGMRLEASVLLEQRKLYEWILEPLYSISGRL
ncbi:HlyD family efflux transporter periplasmic adaptor subunit [Massilia sp. SR12]